MDNKTMLHSQKVYFCNDEELATMQTEYLRKAGRDSWASSRVCR